MAMNNPPDRGRRLLVAGALLASVLAPPTARGQVQAPGGKVLLTVTGQVGKPNVGRTAQFDQRSLEALPQLTLAVDTPWYPRRVSFRGPLLRDVLAAAGATGTRIRAVALNDYAVEIPFGDAAAHDVIVALTMDGRPMSARDKGPLFIIYPYQKFPPAEVKTYHDRSVWQLTTLELK